MLGQSGNLKFTVGPLANRFLSSKGASDTTEKIGAIWARYCEAGTRRGTQARAGARETFVFLFSVRVVPELACAYCYWRAARKIARSPDSGGTAPMLLGRG